MIENSILIRNKAGIHCRPSSVILAETEKFPDSAIHIIADNGESDLKSILELLALGLQCGDVVRIQVSGGHEAEALNRFSELFAKEFDFPQNN